jgi:hypothetical protein
MKILEPFSGYKLASAHPMFHLALFFASFSVNHRHQHENGDNIDEMTEIETHFVTSFIFLRWSHLIVFALVFPDWFGDRH